MQAKTGRSLGCVESRGLAAHQLEREIAGHRQKAARYKAQQDTVTTPAQADAIEHEVQFRASGDRAAGKRGVCQPGAHRDAGSHAGCGAGAGGGTRSGTLEKTRERVAGEQKELAEQQAALGSSAKRCARAIAAGVAEPASTASPRAWHRNCPRRKSAVHGLPHGRAATGVEPAARRRVADLRQLRTAALLGSGDGAGAQDAAAGATSGGGPRDPQAAASRSVALVRPQWLLCSLGKFRRRMSKSLETPRSRHEARLCGHG